MNSALTGIEPITTAMTSAMSMTNVPSLNSAPQIQSAEFGSMLTNGIQQLDASLKQADSQLQAFALGEAVSTHDVMISLEKARFSLQMAVELRNRLVESYQELTRMQL